MNRSLTLSDVLSDIEFELVVGAVSRDEIGQGLQQVRRYQSQMRSQVLDPTNRREMALADLASRQFQMNDLLLTLFQELAAKVQAVQLELRKAAYLKGHPAAPAASQPSPAPSSGAAAPEVMASAWEVSESAWMPDFLDVEEREATEIEAAMHSDALAVGLDVRPADVPVIGWLATRLRTALHSVALFYVGKLAKQQTDVNRLYGEWILSLHQVSQSQGRQIDTLRSQLSQSQGQIEALQSQVTALRTQIEGRRK